MYKSKVIIIGSGLGGLSTGVILAKNGYDVTIFEQSSQIGGCLQCFVRKGVKFETGMHFIGSADEGQTIDKLMQYLEIKDDIRLSRLDPDGYDVVSLGGKRYKIPCGRERFIKQMSAYFPDQEGNLERYFDLIEKVSSASSLHSLRHAESDAVVNTEYQLRSINEVIDSIITDPTLSKVLVGNLPLYAAEKDKTPFSIHAFIMDFYNQSSFRIVGGSDSIAIALAKSLERHGGRIRKSSKVTKILCNDSQAVGVEINNSEIISSDIVISDAHPIRTLELLDTKLIRPAFRKRICSIPQTIGAFSVYLHFKKETVPYMNHNFYGYTADTPWGCENYDEASWPKGYLYMHFCHEDSPKYAETGVILSYMHMRDVEKWRGSHIGQRGDDYASFKEKKARLLLSILEKQFPGIAGKISHYYTSTPLTYLDYTGTEGGAMYGVAKDISMGAAYRVPHKTKVPNVYLTGQNINSHGLLGVLVGAIVTSSELLTAKTIYEQVTAANL